MANPILDQIRNSKEETPKVPENAVVATEAPEIKAEWEPKKGEVLYEPAFEGALVRTALPDGKEVGFPYIASDSDEISFLDAFVEHNGMLTRKEG